jgi:hypothetical protein
VRPLRHALSLLLLAAVAAPGIADAQTAPARDSATPGAAAPNGQAKPNGRSNGIGKRTEPEPPAYEDRLIDGGNLQPDLHDEFAGLASRDGWPRALRVELFATRLDRNGVSTTENGIGLGGYLATPAYGYFTLDGTIRTDGGGTAVLWQRDVPFDGGWRANNGLGTVNTTAIDLARLQPRFVLPSSPALGASTEWRSIAGTQLTAAAGEPGFFSGIRVPRFERLGGSVLTAGVNDNLRPGLAAGLQWIEADNTALTTFAAQPANAFSSRTLFGAVAWDGPGIRVQSNAIGGNVLGGDQRFGGWVDAAFASGRVLHTAGAFYIEPDLAWGNQPIANDMQGGYYRASYRSRQWLADGGVDFIKSVSPNRPDATFLTGSTRYQFTRDIGAGAGINWLHSDDSSWSAYAFAERNHPWGIGRLQFDAAEDTGRRDLQLKYEQTWAMPAAMRLTTAVGVGRLSDPSGDHGRLLLQAIGGGDIAPNLSIDGNVSWSSGSGALNPTGTYANVGLNWHFDPRWLLTVGYYENRTDTAMPLTVTSPIAPPAAPTETVKDRGIFLTLRFDVRAGMPTMALGGPAGAGTGRIAGIVFLDANDDGRLDGGELGAANVTVVLDGRFSIRTDSQGRFEFPAVAAGRHFVTVMPDNLPLPWTLSDDTRDFQLPVRGSVFLELSARRPR